MKYFRLILASIWVLLLVSCSSGPDEVRQWMADTRNQTKVAAPKLPEPKTFTPYVYKVSKDIDPFSSSKLTVAIAKWQAMNSKGKKPNVDRRREPLEDYPLDTIKMVGMLEKPGVAYAILTVDRLVFQAKVGNYVGQNFGMITAVKEAGIDITEVVQDASGEWVERKARLELQETKQETKK